MMDATSARERTAEAFRSVRRRSWLTSACLVAAHAALGALFGTLLAWLGDGSRWALGVLSVLGAAGSAAWTLARLPDVSAGRLIERRFPACRNVVITADEVLSGALAVTEPAAGRVFERAAGMLGGVDVRNAVPVWRAVSLSLVVVAASAAVIALIWRAALRILD